MESALILSCFKKQRTAIIFFALAGAYSLIITSSAISPSPIHYYIYYISDKVKSVSDNVECLIHILYTYYLPIYHSYLFHSSSCFLSLLCFPSFFPSLRHSHDSHPFPFSFLIPFPSIPPLEGVGEGFFSPFSLIYVNNLEIFHDF